MFRIEMLPAEQGDALFVEYGSARSPHRVLIDAGVRKTSGLVSARIAELPATKRHFDLLIVTHVDSDHIGGIPKLLADRSLGVTFEDVWFNGWRHLQPDRLGPVEGEIFSAQLDKLGWNWNAAFDEKAVVVRPRGKLPKRELAGGMTLTLLSPTRQRLEVLREEWQKVVEKAGLEAGVQDENLDEAAARRGIPDLLGDRLDVEKLADVPLLPDKAPANGSTIAVLAEYGRGGDRKSCLLTGDAHPDVFEEGLKRLCKDRRVDRIAVSALKVPHHGSRFNVSKGALDLVETDRYLFSTNGNQTKHPHLEGVARTIERGGAGSDPTLYFNYKVETTAPWDDGRLQRKHKYRAVYPDAGTKGLTVDL
jgi:beta-lactamase superfamily II metal-dependent hydrolase